MSARLPADPEAFVAAAERATNTADPDWAMGVYAPGVQLELIGDGVHQRHDGSADVRRALQTSSAWFAATRTQVRKTLLATSGDTLVLTWEGTVLGGRKKTHGAEIYRFDAHGKVIHNVLYTSLDPKPPAHPLAGVRMLVGHPRITLAYLRVQLRGR